jgi:hypothetical protein
MLLDLRDPSTVPLNFTKSINLALSERGIHSMRNAGVAGLIDAVLADTIPMHGRMIHGRKNGHLFGESQQYDIHGRVCQWPLYRDIMLTSTSSFEPSTVQASTSDY